MMMQDIPRPKPVQAPVPPPPQIAQQKPIEKPEPQKAVQPTPQEPKPEDVPGAGAGNSRVPRETRRVQGCADRCAARIAGAHQQLELAIAA